MNRISLIATVALLPIFVMPCLSQEICRTDSEFGKGINVMIPSIIKRYRTETVTLDDGNVITRQVPEVATVTLSKSWNVGQTLLVQFLDENIDQDLRSKVIWAAREWERFVNLRFIFAAPGESAEDYGLEAAHIRISHNHDGHWSMIGTDSLPTDVDGIDPSMNLEIDSTTDNNELRRVVLHEFGHALGFQHEHQNPRDGISWKQPDARDYYQRTLNWSREKVEHNIFQKLNSDENVATQFDARSIMLYAIPKGLTRDGFWVSWNNELSDTDKAAASGIYPSAQDNIGRAIVRIAPGWFPEGAMVTSIQQDSVFNNLQEFGNPGSIWRLDPGDVITHINGNRIRHLENYFNLIEHRNGRFVIRVRDIRTGKDFEFQAR